MERFGLVQFTRKTGKITMSMEGYSSAMLNLWALQRTTKTRDTIVFSIDTGLIQKYYEGTEDFPKVYDAGEKHEVKHIDGYCPGLLEAYRKDSKLEEVKDNAN